MRLHDAGSVVTAPGLRVAAPSPAIAENLLTVVRKNLNGGTNAWPGYSISILCPSGTTCANGRSPGRLRFTVLALPSLLILEHRLVYLPEPHRRGVGAWVRERSAVATFAAIFDALWAVASPQPHASEAMPGPAEAELLHMLVKGLTNPAIARRLGVSPRTVERRIARLAHEVGANGKVQLVSEAARRSWL